MYTLHTCVIRDGNLERSWKDTSNKSLLEKKKHKKMNTLLYAKCDEKIYKFNWTMEDVVKAL